MDTNTQPGPVAPPSTQSETQRELTFGEKAVGNLYKEAGYSVYHNTMLEMISVLCTSAEPQSKVEKIMSMIINARQDIAVQDVSVKKEIDYREDYTKENVSQNDIKDKGGFLNAYGTEWTDSEKIEALNKWAINHNKELNELKAELHEISHLFEKVTNKLFAATSRIWVSPEHREEVSKASA